MSRTHFVGIAGIGMSAVARVMLGRGLEVSGSDKAEFPVMAELRALGAHVDAGYDAAHVTGAGTVVMSTATKSDNPELVAARAAGARVVHRSVALAQLLEGRRAVAVAGTHGKTTTTSMLLSAVQACGLDPSYAVGGEPVTGAGNGHHGSDDLFVIEADESDGSFLVYGPHAAIVTNLEPDHLDHHGTAEAYTQAFRDFAATVTGFVVVCMDDPGAAALLDGGPVRTYGTSPGADLRMLGLTSTPEGTSFEAVLRGSSLGRVRLQVAGEHLARNAAGALLLAIELGMPAAQAISGLEGYSGVRRRMELKGTAGDVRVYDDYAHHPTEVRAQLLAGRGMAGGGRLIVVFQPHLYSRTQAFAAAFGEALSLADEVVVLDVYGAREEPVDGVSGALIADRVSSHAAFVPDRQEAVAKVVELARPGDLVITLGAGDVTELGPRILALLERR